MGRQGRLPNWTAPPRRGFLDYLQMLYMKILDTLAELSLKTWQLAWAK
jgi:hypothetical protein